MGPGTSTPWVPVLSAASRSPHTVLPPLPGGSECWSRSHQVKRPAAGRQGLAPQISSSQTSLSPRSHLCLGRATSCSQLGEGRRQERAGEALGDWRGQRQCPRWPSVPSLAQGAQATLLPPFSFLPVAPGQCSSCLSKAFEASGRVQAAGDSLRGTSSTRSCAQLRCPRSATLVLCMLLPRGLLAWPLLWSSGTTAPMVS